MVHAVDYLHKWYLETYTLTRTQLWAVLAIANETDRPAQLAKILGIERPGVTRLVDQLVKKGYVRRSRFGDDRRAIHLTLTEKARQALPTLQRAARNADELLMTGVAERDKALMREVAKRVIANAEDLRPIHDDGVESNRY